MVRATQRTCTLRSLMAVCLIAVSTTFTPAGYGESIERATAGDIAEIRTAFRNIGLRRADVISGSDGRVTLIGEYENRDEVETAFSAARAVVGLRRVAPTTPANIKYRLKDFGDAFTDTVGRMMRRPNSAKNGVPTEVSSAGPKPPPGVTAVAAGRARTFGMILGIGQFRNLPEQNYLEFADKDALDFRNLLTSPAGGGVPNENIYLLRHEQATAKAVHEVMRGLLRDTQAGDTVVVFVASHGIPNAMGKFDIVLFDTEFTRKQAGPNGQSVDLAVTNRATALTDDDFQQFIAQLVLKNVRTVVVLDTCYSGRTFVAVPGFLPSRTRSLTQYEKEVNFSTSPSPEAIADLAQKAKNADATRIVVVSASENEESLEYPDVGGGMFTQLYIASLEKVHDYADAFDRTKPLVIKRARRVGYSQTPRLLVVPEEAVTKM